MLSGITSTVCEPQERLKGPGMRSYGVCGRSSGGGRVIGLALEGGIQRARVPGPTSVARLQ